MATEYHSQRDEQEHILPFFGDFVGRFLDIGAADGKTMSNTYHLALKGWGGVCVEPNPFMSRGLLETYMDRDDILCICAALHAVSGVVPFHVCNDFTSTTEAAHVERWEEIIEFKSILAGTVRVEDIPGPFDMINIDTEGTNLEMLRLMPETWMKHVRLLCIEYDNQLEAIIPHCASVGLKEIHRTEENLILARN